MKKIIYSFIFIFVLFFTINTCKAYTITSPSGKNFEVADDYVTYCCYGRDEYNEQVLVSRQKGVFKLEWSSNWKSYAFKFYPEGSDKSSVFDVYYYFVNEVKLSTNQSTYIGGKLIISDCNTDVIYSNILNPDGNEKEGDYLYNSETGGTVGDSSSRLKLTYEYNDINTACKVNATLENGAFTDRIYYSNYMPGIDGSLKTKKAFPRERTYFNRKSVFIFSSRR